MTVSTRSRQSPAGIKRAQPSHLSSNPTPPEPRRLPGAVVFLITAALVGAVGMLYLLQTNHVANLGYEMSELQAEREAALVEQQELSAQIAEKQSLLVVESTARQELGMRPIDNYVFIDVEIPAPRTGPLTEPKADDQPSVLDRFWGRITGRTSHSPEASEHE